VGKVRIISKNSEFFIHTGIKNAYWLRGSECVNLWWRSGVQFPPCAKVSVVHYLEERCPD
jgi:hypothetical protein